MTKKNSKNLTPEMLIEQANIALSNMQPELALKFYERALLLTPNDTNIMDALSDVYIQLGDSIKGKELLLNSVALQPTMNPYKWMYLAQLQQGLESKNSYIKGIELLLPLANDNIEIRQHLCKIYCSIAELYLTDLCYEEDAEESCERAINEALSLDNNSIDARQTLVNLKLSQNRGNEAIIIIKEVYNEIKSIIDHINSKAIINELKNENDDDNIVLPELDFCVSTCKLLIECASFKPELAEYAVDLGSELLNLDDDNIELWYIIGVAALGLDPPDIDTSKYHLERALTMMNEMIEKDKNSFIYHEEYKLVQEHLKIVENYQPDCTDSKNLNITTKNNENLLADEEEWSDTEMIE